MLNKQNIILCLPGKQDGDERQENGNSHCTTARSKTRLLALPEKEREREHMVIKLLMALCNIIAS